MLGSELRTKLLKLSLFRICISLLDPLLELSVRLAVSSEERRALSDLESGTSCTLVGDRDPGDWCKLDVGLGGGGGGTIILLGVLLKLSWLLKLWRWL